MLRQKKCRDKKAKNIIIYFMVTSAGVCLFESRIFMSFHHLHQISADRKIKHWKFTSLFYMMIMMKLSFGILFKAHWNRIKSMIFYIHNILSFRHYSTELKKHKYRSKNKIISFVLCTIHFYHRFFHIVIIIVYIILSLIFYFWCFFLFW